MVWLWNCGELASIYTKSSFHAEKYFFWLLYCSCCLQITSCFQICLLTTAPEKKKRSFNFVHMPVLFLSFLPFFVYMAADSSRHDEKILQIASQCEDSHTNLYSFGGFSKGCWQWQSSRYYYIYSWIAMGKITSRAEVIKRVCIHCLPGIPMFKILQSIFIYLSHRTSAWDNYLPWIFMAVTSSIYILRLSDLFNIYIFFLVILFVPVLEA